MEGLNFQEIYLLKPSGSISLIHTILNFISIFLSFLKMCKNYAQDIWNTSLMRINDD